MVVVSGNWVKNVTAYPSPTISTNVVKGTHNMAPPKAVLSMRPNSHHFTERTLILDQPVKVGRSVARAKATPHNAIFDCKVLSRHHALVWYEDGKFFLQDTKSSNGTFVNNNKLQSETENHELSSGDIVQFGVDVVENNRKITHGCIIATIRLYMPDGKEAKASPSITEGERHGMVPLDDLYRLNQIIKEANEREQCLENKLSALQNAVDETRRSAEESWQVYVGEERLLSRVSALENQLQHSNRNWGEDKLREELTKLQDDNEAYQIAAKEALEKLHAEKLEAVALALKHQRAWEAEVQEAQIAKDHFAEAQLELEVIARRLSEQQKEYEEQRTKIEKQEQELKAKLQSESAKVMELQMKLHELNALSIEDFHNLGRIDDSREKPDLIYDDDLKCKEDLLAENEVCESLNRTNGSHINLTVVPVESSSDAESNLSSELDSPPKSEQEHAKKVTFQDESHSDSDDTENNKEINEKTDGLTDHVDSKTLKYQFQSAQNELKRKIEILESLSNANKLKIAELLKTLDDEKDISRKRLEENTKLKEDLIILEQKLKESFNENQQYRDRIDHLGVELETVQNKLKSGSNIDTNDEKEGTVENEKQFTDVSEKQAIVVDRENHNVSQISNNEIVTQDQLVCLEEELVMLKERFAQVSEEKLKLFKDLLTLREQYNTVCNRSHNKYFFYIAPLIAMVLYLLVSAMIS